MLVKVKPTSPGRRQLVKVVTPGLHKGKPVASLVERESKNAGRNVHGHITILDRRGLQAASCECYAVVKAHFDRLDV